MRGLVQKKTQVEDQVYSQLMKLFEAQISCLLRCSKVHIAKGSRQAAGFNKPDRKGESVLAKVLKHKLFSLARQMIASGTLDLFTQQKSTGLAPMHLIANHIDDVSTVHEIFKAIDKRHVNVLDKEGNSPLHYAAIKRNLPMCQMLCEFAGLNVNAKNRFGCTPLHMSLFSFNEKKDHSPALERYLLNQGADPMSLDSDQRIPLVYLFFKGCEPAAG